VLASFAPQFGLDRETALKAACGLGAGFACLGETCGAVTGGIMVIGLRYGHTRSDDGIAKAKTYEMVRHFITGFKEQHGTIICRDLIGCDISTPEGLASARERGLFRDICTRYVGNAVELVETLI
jgi:C_GCAxxG_C_C family probable redox protein